MRKKIYYSLLLFGFVLGVAAACCKCQEKKLTILHTNDTHSQVEPVDPDAKYNGNLGGYARRIELIEQVRDSENVLLVDAGDFSQGTPYFNIFKGAVEIDAMNRMGYDAVVLGNHEFDNPVDTLAKYLSEAEFAVVISNYKVENSPLKDIVKPYHIVHKKGIKIGIVGAGINLEGLVSMANIDNVIYTDPLAPINEYAKMLKEDEHCDVVVCLSHLGYKYDNDKLSDVKLAQNTRNVDVIIGGHTHSFVEGERVANLDGDSVVISQMRKSGAYVGKLQLSFE